MKSTVSILILLFSLPTFAVSLRGGGGYNRSGNSESTRWTLSGWMAQKQQFRMQDQWLALNRQDNSFEFGITGGHSTYDTTANGVTKQHDVTEYSAQLWYSIFGLEYTFADSSEDFTSESAQANIRIFGTSSRSTFWTINYGVRKIEYENPKNEVENQFAGSELNLYLMNFFGIKGAYKKYFRAEDESAVDHEGARGEYGIFFDFGFLRVSGTYFRETTELTPSGGSMSEQKREGLQTGVQFHL